jgi:hypothetical protein
MWCHYSTQRRASGQESGPAAGSLLLPAGVFAARHVSPNFGSVHLRGLNATVLRLEKGRPSACAIVQPMLNDVWILSLVLGSIAVPGLYIVRSRGWRTTAGAACPAITAPETSGGRQEEVLAPTIEAAEQQLALLYRRMRAYLRDPYDYAESRITSELAFEQCLDLAVSLNIRMSDLSGAASAGAEERDRIRGLILQGLLVSHRLLSRSSGM